MNAASAWSLRRAAARSPATAQQAQPPASGPAPLAPAAALTAAASSSGPSTSIEAASLTRTPRRRAVPLQGVWVSRAVCECAAPAAAACSLLCACCVTSHLCVCPMLLLRPPATTISALRIPLFPSTCRDMACICETSPSGVVSCDTTRTHPVANRCCSRVVLPEPRKPVTSSTGTASSGREGKQVARAAGNGCQQ